MQFSREWSWLLWVLAGGLVLFYALFLVRNRVIARRLHSRSRATWVKLLLRLTYIALVFLALLGPRFGQSTLELRSAGRQVYVVLDLSQSMLARDVPPNRLTLARQAVETLLQRFPQDRFGLIAAGQEARLLSPHTFDKKALQLFLSAMQPQPGNAAGADMASAILLARDKLSPYINIEKGEQQSAVILLVTDGEGLEADAAAAVRSASRKGIVVMGLCVGSPAGSTLVSSDGRPLRINGSTVRTAADFRALDALCKQGGGAAFPLTPDNATVDGLSLALNALQVQTRQVKSVDVRADKYIYFLVPALFLLFADVLFTIKVIKL